MRRGGFGSFHFHEQSFRKETLPIVCSWVLDREDLLEAFPGLYSDSPLQSRIIASRSHLSLPACPGLCWTVACRSMQSRLSTGPGSTGAWKNKTGLKCPYELIDNVVLSNEGNNNCYSFLDIIIDQILQIITWILLKNQWILCHKLKFSNPYHKFWVWRW